MILAKKTSDFDDIRRKLEARRFNYNETAGKGIKILLRGPDTHSEQRFRGDASREQSEYKEVMRLWIMVIIILIVVPAFNMMSFTISRMKKRQEELGLRRSFGALRSNIIGQVIAENMLLTLIGGFLGFLLSGILIFAFQSTLFPDGVSLSLSMIFRPSILAYLLGVCVLVNLVSAIIPAVRSANQPILQALKEKKA
jgi:putative ABC transport system permease protein